MEAMFKWIEGKKDLGKVDVCVANAGLSTNNSLLEGEREAAALQV